MQTGNEAIRMAGQDDADVIADILADGFQSDPPLQWMLPEASDRLRRSRLFFEPFVELVLAEGRAYVSEDLNGAALWLDVDVDAPPPPDDGSLNERLRESLGEANANRFLVIGSLFDAHHPGDESHAYLPFIGVRGAAQDRGIGSALLAHRLREIDIEGRPAYLEASSDGNVALYRRFGFAPLGQPLPLPDGPSFFPMWRPAQRAVGG
jgi:ribosomal protein S18 acetylase RimI-like enzyme